MRYDNFAKQFNEDIFIIQKLDKFFKKYEILFINYKDLSKNYEKSLDKISIYLDLPY